MRSPTYPFINLPEIILLSDLLDISEISLVIQKESHMYTHDQLTEIYSLLAERITELKQQHYN
jgi:hypothetical protein